MPQYTVTAFRWSGTGYNAQYNTSYTATLDDNDPDYDGGSDPSESISINGGPFNSTGSAPYAINISFTDTGGNFQVETFYFFFTGGNWYFVPAPGSAFTVGATLGTLQSFSVGWSYADITCFVQGTRILTASGEQPIESLTPGTRVLGRDGRYKRLRLALSTTVSAADLARFEKLRPVRIMAGALGDGLPKRDLLVSRQHRMLVSSAISERMFGQKEALIAAARLTELPGIFVETQAREVTYHHLVFDRHEVIYAEGAPSESFFTGPNALASLPPEAREEFRSLFPGALNLDIAAQSACLIPPRRQQKQLVARHLKNNKPLLGMSLRSGS